MNRNICTSTTRMFVFKVLSFIYACSWEIFKGREGFASKIDGRFPSRRTESQVDGPNGDKVTGGWFGILGRNTNLPPDDGCPGVSTSLFTLADPSSYHFHVWSYVVKACRYPYPMQTETYTQNSLPFFSFFFFFEGRSMTDLGKYQNHTSPYVE